MNKFDKIYILHLAESKERYNHILDLQSKYDFFKNADIWWTTKRKISDDIADNIYSLKTTWLEICKQHTPNVYGNVFNCSLEHYTMIKSCYLRGFEHICIMEDDVTINSNVSNELVNAYIEQIPDDYDFLLLYNNLYRVEHSYDELGIIHEVPDCFEYKNDGDFFSLSSIDFFGTTAYCLNRNGMKAYIDSADNNFCPADLNRINIDMTNYKQYITNYKIFDIINDESTIEH